MPTPYYARNRTDFDLHPIEADIVLYWPIVRRVIGHVPKININTLAPSVVSNLIKGIAFIEHCASNKQESYEHFRKIVETYHELLCLAANTGLTKRIYAVYVKVFESLEEGQNELFNSNEMVDRSKDADNEILYKALIDKYHVQHEGNLRYSITPAILALDAYTSHKDLNNKTDDEYCRDDLSYKLHKLIEQETLNLHGQVSALEVGVEPHIRNSISHRTFEYMEGGNVTFFDRHKTGTWQRTLSLPQFRQLVFDADFAFCAHIAAQTLFVHDYQHTIDFTCEPIFKTTKQLRTLIDQLMIKLLLTPTDIVISDEDSLIECVGTKQPGTDRPTEMFGNMDGIRFHRTIPALKAENQALAVLERIAALRTTYKRCIVTINDSVGKKLIGTIEADLEELTAIRTSPTGTKEAFKAQIKKNTFPRETAER